MWLVTICKYKIKCLVKRSIKNMLVLTEYNITGELASPTDLVSKLIAIGCVISGLDIMYQNNS